MFVHSRKTSDYLTKICFVMSAANIAIVVSISHGMFCIFFSQSQLRNHERDHHSFSGDVAALAPVTETVAMVEEAERVTDEGKTGQFFFFFMGALC